MAHTIIFCITQMGESMQFNIYLCDNFSFIYKMNYYLLSKTWTSFALQCWCLHFWLFLKSFHWSPLSDTGGCGGGWDQLFGNSPLPYTRWTHGLSTTVSTLAHSPFILKLLMCCICHHNICVTLCQGFQDKWSLVTMVKSNICRCVAEPCNEHTTCK